MFRLLACCCVFRLYGLIARLCACLLVCVRAFACVGECVACVVGERVCLVLFCVCFACVFCVCAVACVVDCGAFCVVCVCLR